MARDYRLSPARRALNRIVRPLIRIGLGGRHTYLLTVVGRRSGRRYSTPVRLVEDGGRWLVAPYGERGWVRNARAAGWVELSRAGRTERLRTHELGANASAPLLREYVRKVQVTRPFFDAAPDSPLERFADEAESHPVFELLSDGELPRA